jgi:hypothetical protein
MRTVSAAGMTNTDGLAGTPNGHSKRPSLLLNQLLAFGLFKDSEQIVI